MGFDPSRRHRRTSFDYWYVGAGLIVVIALLAWALFG
jgi:hypothetical protein